MSAIILESGIHRPYAKAAGAEPLPGYTLLEPLGRGGFGEVWKCEAPGGLLKAVKFVAPSTNGNELRQELAAFEQIKAIRHPFMLTLERVELVEQELVMVMELADCQLQDRFRACVSASKQGIPRDELLGYLADAAEALDVIASKFGLQHLDVKPANLFITSGRVKVGDYGLVSQLEGAKAGTDANRGLTPKYVAPEVLSGEPSQQSDQYSLALVYQELLTGTFPYTARSPQHMMLQHVIAAPDLSKLPETDRAAVAKALSKKPEDRFPFCLEFIHALLSSDKNAAANPSLALRRARLDRSAIDPAALTGRHTAPDDPAALTGRHRAPGELTQNSTVVAATQQTTPAPLPPLVSTATRRSTPTVKLPTPPRDEDLPLVGVVAEPPGVKLDRIRVVMPIGRLLGTPPGDVRLTGQELVAALVNYAAGDTPVPTTSGDFVRTAADTWVCRFPTTVPATLAPLKLVTVGEHWGTSVENEAGTIVMRKFMSGSLWNSLAGKGKKNGIEVFVNMPKPGRQVGEVEVTAKFIGTPDAAFTRSAYEFIPNLLTGIRRELANVQDRRKHPRVATDMRVSIFPLHGDGRVEAPLPGRCRDVSLGGFCIATAVKMPTTYAYLAFDDVPQLAGHAILVKVLRSKVDPNGRDHVHAGPFRMEL